MAMEVSTVDGRRTHMPTYAVHKLEDGKDTHQFSMIKVAKLPLQVAIRLPVAVAAAITEGDPAAVAITHLVAQRPLRRAKGLE